VGGRRCSNREEFPFVNGDGNEVFTVETDGMGDVAGDCTLKDARTGEGVVLFDDGFSTFRNDWKVRDAEAEATIAELKRLGQPQRGNE
jgi:hypothetical protein